MLTTSYWPADTSVPLVEHTVGSLLASRADTDGASLALVGNAHGSGTELRLTYSELHEQALRVATALAQQCEPGELVALWAPNVVEWPIVSYGAALAGVVLVALNPVLRAGELTYALNHSGAAVLIHADRSRDYDLAAVVGQVRAECPALRVAISLSDRNRWIAEYADADLLRARPRVAPDDPAMLQYTSGTTGNPKGVLLRHRSLVNVAKLTVEAVDIPTHAVAINPLPMFHTAGCVIATLGPLWLGGVAVLIENFDPATVLDRMIEEQADVLFFVPAVLGAVLAAAATGELPAPRLHTILGGAAVVPAEMIEAAEAGFGANVVNVFGQTELAPVLTATRAGDGRELALSTVGRPLPQVDCAILDPATGEVTPIGVPGEICARGYQQMIGYLHDPVATAAAVDPAGFLHTGDLGSMDSTGHITLTGRLKELIIRGGENISPAEIEACLLTHESVAQACVVGVPDERLGELVVGVLQLNGPAGEGLVDDLVRHCRRLLSPHKVPARWYAVEVFPVTPTGKIQKFRVVEALEGPASTRLG